METEAFLKTKHVPTTSFYQGKLPSLVLCCISYLGFIGSMYGKKKSSSYDMVTNRT